MRGRNTAASEIFKKYKSDDVTLLPKAFSVGIPTALKQNLNPSAMVPDSSAHSPAPPRPTLPTSTTQPQDSPLVLDHQKLSHCGAVASAVPSASNPFPQTSISFSPLVSSVDSSSCSFSFLITSPCFLLITCNTVGDCSFAYQTSSWNGGARSHARRASWLSTWHEPMSGKCMLDQWEWDVPRAMASPRK